MCKGLSHSNKIGFCVLWLLCHYLSPLIFTFGSILTEIWIETFYISRWTSVVSGKVWQEIICWGFLLCKDIPALFTRKKNQWSLVFFHLPSYQLIIGEMAVPTVFPGRVEIQALWLKVPAIIHFFAKDHSTILPHSGY